MESKRLAITFELGFIAGDVEKRSAEDLIKRTDDRGLKADRLGKMEIYWKIYQNLC